MCSRHRGGVSESPCAALFCAVPCRAVPPVGGGGGAKRPCAVPCQVFLPTRSFAEAHMYQWFRLDGILLIFMTVAFATFCVLSLGVAPCVFQLIHDFNSIIHVNQW